VLHPFPPERHVGSVYRVEAGEVEITLPRAAGRPQVHLGQRLARGEVGEFLIVDVGGLGILGRLSEVWVTAAERDKVAEGVNPGASLAPVGRLQLLATLKLDGTHIRGIGQYPRLGDPVYSAPADVLEIMISEDVQGSVSPISEPKIKMGTLASNDQVTVDLSASRLFGRHLAILGATGSGKSWTLAHLVEEVARIGGKMILVDATGEFHTLGDAATHVSIGPDSGSGAKALPHTDLDEADLNAFLRPSSGAQLPKLREAIRSLRLAHILGLQHSLVDEQGCISKAGRPRSDFFDVRNEHSEAVEKGGSPFDLRCLPQQIEHECVFGHDRYDEDNFGGAALNDLGYCTSLITRIHDLLQTPEVFNILVPGEDILSILESIDSFLDQDGEGILCISLQSLPFVHFLREIAVNSLGRHLLALARKGRFKETPLLVGVDEAQQFFGRMIGDDVVATRLEHFETIAKEGRKYGLTVCMATQRPGDLPPGVLSQAGMLLVHRLGDGRDRKYVEDSSSELDHSSTKLLPGLTPGEAIFVGVDFPVPVAVRVRPPVRKPESDGPKYSDGWNPS
jgi:hypothetical protein